MLDGGNQEVCELQLLTAGVLVAPLPDHREDEVYVLNLETSGICEYDRLLGLERAQ